MGQQNQQIPNLKSTIQKHSDHNRKLSLQKCRLNHLVAEERVKKKKAEAENKVLKARVSDWENTNMCQVNEVKVLRLKNNDGSFTDPAKGCIMCLANQEISASRCQPGDFS